MIDQDKHHAELFNERFKFYTDKWYALLQLANWQIDYEMTDVIDNDPTIEAQCNVDTQLGHKAKIIIAERMAYEDDRTRESLVVHEMVYIILDELGQFTYLHLPDGHHAYFTRLLEIATSDLARILAVLGEPRGNPGQ